MMQVSYILYFLLVAILACSEGQIKQGNFLPAPMCFTERNGTVCPANLTNSCSLTPECLNISQSQMYFYLFTCENKENPEFLHKYEGHLPKNSLFNASLVTIIMVPGYSDGPCRTAHWREMKDQIFCRTDQKYNVILIDYTRFNFPDYKTAVDNMLYVSKIIACVINILLDEPNSSAKNIYIIGHSLGAHIAGAAAARVPGCGRLTGLDPAGPSFQPGSGNEHINRTQAEFVDIYHAGGGCKHCFPYFSCLDAQGHVDVYYNGGSCQKSCFNYIIPSLIKGDFFYFLFSLLIQGCPHLQVLQFFKVSINSCKCQPVAWKANNCKERNNVKKECVMNGNQSNCVVAGFDADKYLHPRDNCSHKYYIDTLDFCPYFSNDDIQLNGFLENTNPKNYTPHCCSISSDEDIMKNFSYSIFPYFCPISTQGSTNFIEGTGSPLHCPDGILPCQS